MPNQHAIAENESRAKDIKKLAKHTGEYITVEKLIGELSFGVLIGGYEALKGIPSRVNIRAGLEGCQYVRVTRDELLNVRRTSRIFTTIVDAQCLRLHDLLSDLKKKAFSSWYKSGEFCRNSNTNNEWSDKVPDRSDIVMIKGKSIIISKMVNLNSQVGEFKQSLPASERQPSESTAFASLFKDEFSLRKTMSTSSNLKFREPQLESAKSKVVTLPGKSLQREPSQELSKSKSGGPRPFLTETKQRFHSGEFTVEGSNQQKTNHCKGMDYFLKNTITVLHKIREKKGASGNLPSRNASATTASKTRFRHSTGIPVNWRDKNNTMYSDNSRTQWRMNSTSTLIFNTENLKAEIRGKLAPLKNADDQTQEKTLTERSLEKGQAFKKSKNFVSKSGTCVASPEMRIPNRVEQENSELQQGAALPLAYRPMSSTPKVKKQLIKPAQGISAFNLKKKITFM